jgi:hypothetical protein
VYQHPRLLSTLFRALPGVWLATYSLRLPRSADRLALVNCFPPLLYPTATQPSIPALDQITRITCHPVAIPLLRRIYLQAQPGHRGNL